MGTFERSPFLRFSSGPSPKHHRMGENPAPGTLPVCPRAPALLPTATEFTVLPPPASRLIPGSCCRLIPGSCCRWPSLGAGGGLIYFQNTTLSPRMAPFPKCSLSSSGFLGLFQSLVPSEKKNLVDLDFLFSNGIWRKKDRD